jgi:hypothetical protein
MSVAESPILADDTGRRRRRLRVVGRTVCALLVAWLGVLALGALGLQPLGRLPLVSLVPDRATPSPLPARVEAAVRTHGTVADAASAGAALTLPAVRARRLPLPVLSVGSPTIGRRHAPVARGAPLATRRPARRRAGGSPSAPAGSAPGSTGGSGSVPAQTTPVAPPASSGTGTTPAPAPTAPGRSGSAPGRTTPVTPPRATPTDPGSTRAGRIATAPAG